MLVLATSWRAGLGPDPTKLEGGLQNGACQNQILVLERVPTIAAARVYVCPVSCSRLLPLQEAGIPR